MSGVGKKTLWRSLQNKTTRCVFAAAPIIQIKHHLRLGSTQPLSCMAAASAIPSQPDRSTQRYSYQHMMAMSHEVCFRSGQKGSCFASLTHSSSLLHTPLGRSTDPLLLQERRNPRSCSLALLSLLDSTTLLMHSHSQQSASLCRSGRNILAGKHQNTPRTDQTMCCKCRQRRGTLDHHYNIDQGHTGIRLIAHPRQMSLVLSRSQSEQAQVNQCQQDSTCDVNAIASIE